MDDEEDPSSGMGCPERTQYAARRVLGSWAYLIFSAAVLVGATLLLLGVAAAALLLSAGVPRILYLLAELPLDLALVLDIALKIAAQGRDYPRHVLNLIDWIVLLLLAGFFAADLLLGIFSEPEELLGSLASAALLALRFLLQLLRILVLLKNTTVSMRNRKRTAEGLDFDGVEDFVIGDEDDGGGVGRSRFAFDDDEEYDDDDLDLAATTPVDFPRATST